MPDWLVVGQEDWDEVERRNQLVMRALAARNPRSRVLFAELPVRGRQLWRARPRRLRRVEANVWCVRAVRPLPDRIAGLRPLNDRVEAAVLRHALRRLAIERPALWTQDPRAATLVDLLPVDRIAYDLTDDWAAFERDPARRAEVQQRIDSLAARADVVFACSPALAAGARGKAARVEELPNAVEPPGPPGRAPAELSRLDRPLLGYAGTLHDSRLDVELLHEAARARPHWTFVLLGPDQLEPASRERLLSAPNVRYLGVKAHAQVRSYLEALDVCLLPNLVDDFTRSLDPLKLYEYLAAGRPVVATPAGIAPHLAPYVRVASTATELVGEAEAALAEDGPEQVARRRAAVASMTWDERAARVEAALGVARRPETARPEVSAVIVSFNTRDLLARTLDALEAQEGVDAEIVVVDNASTDGSPDLVRERDREATLLALPENAGFARANNLAFEHCRGEYVLLLNSDCFLAPGALAELVRVLRRRADAAAVGPRLLNPDGTLQRSAWPFPRAGRLLVEALGVHRVLARLGLLEDLRLWPHDEERAVDFLIGACLLVRREALDEVGGFDERFWLYGEEADLCRRLADRGWKVVLAPQAVATHVGGASSSVSRERLLHFYRGQRRFLRKHGPRGAWPLARLALVVGAALRARGAVVRTALDPKL